MNDAEPRAWIGIGSNDDREAALASALASLAREFGPLAVSSVYASPCANGSESEYWNLAAGFNTVLEPPALRARLKSIETAQGRVRGPSAGGRVRVDLDLLAMAKPGKVMTTYASIEPPHVLLPLAELLPEWRSPEQEFTLAERADRLGAARPRRLVAPAPGAVAGRAFVAEETSC